MHQFGITLFNDAGGEWVGDLPIVITNVRIGPKVTSPEIIWSINSDMSAISESGLLTVVSNEIMDELTVTAAWVSNPDEIFGTAIVTVVGEIMPDLDYDSLLGRRTLYGRSKTPERRAR
jgi:hypothetical protein